MKIVEHVPLADRNLFASEAEWQEEEERLLQELHPDLIIEVPYTEENKHFFDDAPDWAKWAEEEKRLEEEERRLEEEKKRLEEQESK